MKKPAAVLLALLLLPWPPSAAFAQEDPDPPEEQVDPVPPTPPQLDPLSQRLMSLNEPGTSVDFAATRAALLRVGDPGRLSDIAAQFDSILRGASPRVVAGLINLLTPGILKRLGPHLPEGFMERLQAAGLDPNVQAMLAPMLPPDGEEEEEDAGGGDDGAPPVLAEVAPLSAPPPGALNPGALFDGMALGPSAVAPGMAPPEGLDVPSILDAFLRDDPMRSVPGETGPISGRGQLEAVLLGIQNRLRSPVPSMEPIQWAQYFRLTGNTAAADLAAQAVIGELMGPDAMRLAAWRRFPWPHERVVAGLLARRSLDQPLTAQQNDILDAALARRSGEDAADAGQVEANLLEVARREREQAERAELSALRRLLADGRNLGASMNLTRDQLRRLGQLLGSVGGDAGMAGVISAVLDGTASESQRNRFWLLDALGFDAGLAELWARFGSDPPLSAEERNRLHYAVVTRIVARIEGLRGLSSRGDFDQQRLTRLDALLQDHLRAAGPGFAQRRAAIGRLGATMAAQLAEIGLRLEEIALIPDPERRRREEGALGERRVRQYRETVEDPARWTRFQAEHLRPYETRLEAEVTSVLSTLEIRMAALMADQALAAREGQLPAWFARFELEAEAMLARLRQARDSLAALRAEVDERYYRRSTSMSDLQRDAIASLFASLGASQTRTARRFLEVLDAGRLSPLGRIADWREVESPQWGSVLGRLNLPSESLWGAALHLHEMRARLAEFAGPGQTWAGGGLASLDRGLAALTVRIRQRAVADLETARELTPAGPRRLERLRALEQLTGLEQQLQGEQNRALREAFTAALPLYHQELRLHYDATYGVAGGAPSAPAVLRGNEPFVMDARVRAPLLDTMALAELQRWARVLVPGTWFSEASHQRSFDQARTEVHAALARRRDGLIERWTALSPSDRARALERGEFSRGALSVMVASMRAGPPRDQALALLTLAQLRLLADDLSRLAARTPLQEQLLTQVRAGTRRLMDRWSGLSESDRQRAFEAGEISRDDIAALAGSMPAGPARIHALSLLTLTQLGTLSYGLARLPTRTPAQQDLLTQVQALLPARTVAVADDWLAMSADQRNLALLEGRFPREDHMRIIWDLERRLRAVAVPAAGNPAAAREAALTRLWLERAIHRLRWSAIDPDLYAALPRTPGRADLALLEILQRQSPEHLATRWQDWDRGRQLREADAVIRGSIATAPIGVRRTFAEGEAAALETMITEYRSALPDLSRAQILEHFSVHARLTPQGGLSFSLELRPNSPLRALQSLQFLTAGGSQDTYHDTPTAYFRDPRIRPPGTTAERLAWLAEVGLVGHHDPSLYRATSRAAATDATLDVTYLTPVGLARGVAFTSLRTLVTQVGARAAARHLAVRGLQVMGVGASFGAGFYGAGVVAARMDGLNVNFTLAGLTEHMFMGAVLAPVFALNPSAALPMAAHGMQGVSESLQRGHTYTAILGAAQTALMGVMVYRHARASRPSRAPGAPEGPTPYETLGLRPGASRAEVRAAFRREAFRWHPDRNPGDAAAVARFKAIVEAHEALFRVFNSGAPSAGPAPAPATAAGPAAAPGSLVLLTGTSAPAAPSALALPRPFLAPPAVSAAPAAGIRVPGTEMAGRQVAARRSMADLVRDLFGQRPQNPNGVVDPARLIEHLEDIGALPSAPVARRTRLEAFVRAHMGLEGPIELSAPTTTPLSGDQVYLVRQAGNIVAVVKVFASRSASATLVNELGGAEAVGRLGLARSAPVGAHGAFRAGPGEMVYLMEAAIGRDVYAALSAVGRARGAEARGRAMVEAQADVVAVAEAMGELHRVSRTPSVAPETSVYDVVGARRMLEGLRADLSGDVYQSLLSHFERLAPAVEGGGGPGALTHGDAHPGNFFVRNGRVTLIDLETAMYSLDPQGRGAGNPAADIGRFLEAMRLNNVTRGHNLTGGELAALERAFVDAYARESGLAPGSLRNQVAFYRLRLTLVAMSRDPVNRARYIESARLLLAELDALGAR